MLQHPVSAQPLASHQEFRVIRARRGWQGVDLRELWSYHDLLWILAARDIKVRYKQTVLGATWAILQPLFTMAVFALLFALLMGQGNEPTPAGVPYTVSTFCALLPWQLFAHALAASGNSLIENERLITKVYFPRLLIPLASIVAGLVDFAIAFVVLLAMMLWFGVTPGWSILALPLYLALTVVTALSIGLWLSALNALYRDFRYTIPFLVQAGMFITPVVYSAESVLRKFPPWVGWVYGLNPMAGVIEGFRWAMLGTTNAPSAVMLASTVMVLVLLLGGIMYFRRMERTIADWI